MKTLITATLYCSFAILISLTTGCDTESADDNNVMITPQYATIAKGESITFRASGGYDYKWTLEADAAQWATLSNTEGPTVTYTSIADSPSNSTAVVRVLTVTSTIEGSGSDTNITDTSYAHSMEAYITHVASSDPETEPVTLSPDSRTVSANGIVEFTASGGSGSYTWSISPTTYGSLSTASGNKVAYIANDTNVTASVVITVTSGSVSDVGIINQVP